jgi:hypothetical protein
MIKAIVKKAGMNVIKGSGWLVSTSHMNIYTYMGRVAMGWTVRGSNPGGDEIFRTCLDRPWGPASLLYNGYQVIPGGRKLSWRDADPSPLLVPRCKTEESYTSTLPKGLRSMQKG